MQSTSSFTALCQTVGVLIQIIWISVFVFLRGGKMGHEHFICSSDTWSIQKLPQPTTLWFCGCLYGIYSRDKLRSFLRGQKTRKQFASCNIMFQRFLGNLFEDSKLSLANNLSWQYCGLWKWVPNQQDSARNRSPDMSGNVFTMAKPVLCVLKQV